ncbi:MAG TPA: PA14 domain-containing protein, partial [Verrucomicrobiae bacterium]
MKPFLRRWNCRLITSRKVLTLACLLFGCGVAHAQMVDLNGNGISDVWEWMYNRYSMPLADNPDGIGYSSVEEGKAGINPADSKTFPRLTFGMAGSNITVSIPCALGKEYQLQSVSWSPGANWITESNIVARTGANIIFTSAKSGQMKMYRVIINDVDSDGDGVNDWEEYQLGLDPFNAYSNGQQDPLGNAMNDYAYVTGKISQQNRITITASDSATMQPDAGNSATDLGMFTVTRGGFGLNTLNVALGTATPGVGVAKPGVDYLALPGSVFFGTASTSVQLQVRPLANPNLTAPATATLKVMPGTNYGVGGPSNASVVIYPSATGTGTGLMGNYYTGSSTNYTNSANFKTSSLFLTRMDPAIDFNWSTNLTPNLSNGAYTVRWTGQVRPQYSETYIFDTSTDDGVKLWVNDVLLIDKWQSQSVKDWTNTISLQAGVRYDLKMEYLQLSGAAQAHLFWCSPSQPRQIIPSTCFYPTNSLGGSNAPAAITSSLDAVAFLGQPFTYSTTAANVPAGYTASGLPPGLIFLASIGRITGTPTQVGNFSVSLATSNSIGGSGSAVNIQVIDTGSSVVQEIWTNVPGT